MKHQHQGSIRYICFFILGLFSVSLTSAKQSLVVNLSKRIYQADNKNWDIDQDERGMLYVANHQGLLQFDGVHWTLYPLPESTTIRSVKAKNNDSIFTGSFEDFGLWTRTESGSLVYQSLLKKEFKEKQENDEFWSIQILGNSIYFQSFTSIFMFDGTKVRRLDSNYGGFLFLNKVNNKLYAQTLGGGLNEIQKDTIRAIEGSEFLKDTEVRFILPYKNEGLLIGTSSQGFYSYSEGKFVQLSNGFHRVASQSPNVGLCGSNGNYYIGTLSNGLYQLTPDGVLIEHINTDFNLLTNTILALYQDHAGEIWLGLDGGLSLVRNLPKVDFYLTGAGKLGGVYDAIEWNKHLLLATNRKVYALALSDLNKPAQARRWLEIAGTEGQTWKFKLIDQQLFILHNRGAFKLNADFTLGESYISNVGVYDMIKMTQGEQSFYLYGSYFRLYRSSPDGKNKFFFDQLGQPISHIELDHLNNIWLEHPEKGVYRCRFEEHLSRFESIDYYGGDQEIPFKLSLLKVGGRVETYGDGCFYHYDELSNRMVANQVLNKALSHYQIKKVIPLRDSFFWAIGKYSVVKFKYDGYQVKIHTVLETEPYFSMITGYENISCLNDSTHILCLDDGLAVLHDTSTPDTAYKYQVLPKPELYNFEAIHVQKKQSIYYSLPLSKPIHVDYGHNSLLIKTLIPNQFNFNYSLAYRIIGLDGLWHTLHQSNRLTLDRLPVGDYILELKTVDRLGHSSDLTSIEFTINPPWYLSTFAILCYVILTIGIMYVAWVLVLKKYRNMHLRKIRQREMLRLRSKAENLEEVVQTKNAEMLTMTSFIVYKNELINKLKDLVHTYYQKNKLKSLRPLIQQIDTLINQSTNPEDDWKLFLVKFEEKNSNFFAQLKEKYPELTNTDLRLCACLKLNMDTKEIASFMNVTIRSIENRRYRLRKKIGLSADQNLNEFFIQIK